MSCGPPRYCPLRLDLWHLLYPPLYHQAPLNFSAQELLQRSLSWSLVENHIPLWNNKKRNNRRIKIRQKDWLYGESAILYSCPLSNSVLYFNYMSCNTRIESDRLVYATVWLTGRLSAIAREELRATLCKDCVTLWKYGTRSQNWPRSIFVQK